MALPQYDGITDILRLRDADFEHMVHAIAEGQVASSRGRSDERQRYLLRRVPVQLTDRYTHSSRWFAARPYDLSASGLSFLHGCFVYADTECVVDLVRLDGGLERFRGVVCWCRHVERHVHQVGARFSSNINLAAFITIAQNGEDDVAA